MKQPHIAKLAPRAFELATERLKATSKEDIRGIEIAVNNVIAELVTKGYQSGDTRLIQDVQAALNQALTQYASKAWDIVHSRLRDADSVSIAALDAACSFVEQKVAEIAESLFKAQLASASLPEHLRVALQSMDRYRATQVALRKVRLQSMDVKHSVELRAVQPRHANAVGLMYGRNLSAATIVRKLLEHLCLTVIDFEKAKGHSLNPGFTWTHEVIDQLYSEVAAVVIVLTPDEHAELEPQLQADGDSGAAISRLQPRPNVLIELGYAWASHRNRTACVQFGGVDLPTDVQGLHVDLWHNTDEFAIRFRDLLIALGLEPADYRAGTLPSLNALHGTSETQRTPPYSVQDALELPYLAVTTQFTHPDIEFHRNRTDQLTWKLFAERDALLADGWHFVIVLEGGKLRTLGVERSGQREQVLMWRPSANHN